MRKLERDAKHLAKSSAPAREILWRLAVDRVQRHEFGPALRLRRCRNGLGEGAIGRKAAVAEAEQGHRDIRRRGRRVHPVEEPLGRGGRRAIAISRGEDDDALCTGVALWCEARHRANMDALPRCRQRGMQGRGEAPGAATLAADKNDRLGTARGLVAPDARPPAPPGKPDQDAGHAHRRHSERHHPEHKAEHRGPLPRVQHVNGFRDALPPGQVGPCHERAGSLVKIAGAPVGLQCEHVRRIAGIGKAQFAQLGDGRLQQRGHLIESEPNLSAHFGGISRQDATVRQKIEGGGCHPEGGGGGQNEADDGDPGDLDMQPARERTAQGREPVPPSARPSRDQHSTREREDQHRRGPGGHGDAPAIPEEERAMKVGEPAKGLVRVGRGNARARRRVDHGSTRRALIEPIGGDPTGGRPPDLLDARIDDLDALREGGDCQASLHLRRGDALDCRKDRERSAAQAQDRDERECQ